MTHSQAITFVLSSCGRFDLLAETILTFVGRNTAPIARYVVVEDSGRAEVRDVLRGLGPPIALLVNDPPLGQMASIDRAYATVDTPYVFHCEDDWRFFRRGFVEESLAVLAARDDVSAVLARRSGQNPTHDAIVRTAAVERVAGVDVRIPRPDAHPVWGAYSFNPGLRRLADWRACGSFDALGDEAGASAWFKARGQRLAHLATPACETTGQRRHVRRPRDHTAGAPRR